LKFQFGKIAATSVKRKEEGYLEKKKEKVSWTSKRILNVISSVKSF